MAREGVYLGFDFGYKRIGVAVGQKLTCSATPLNTLPANRGIPNWTSLQALIKEWQPQALIVGLPTKIDGSKQYTTKGAKAFAQSLNEQFLLPVHLVDERLTTVEAREQLFSEGGYKNLKKSQVDSVAACVILEQWLLSQSV